MWKPICNLLDDPSVAQYAKKKTLPVPHITIKEENGGVRIIRIPNQVRPGLTLNFGNTVPASIEKTFMKLMLNEIKESFPPSLGINIPPAPALWLGANREHQKKKEGASMNPNLVMYGNSIIRDAAQELHKQNKLDNGPLDLELAVATKDFIDIFSSKPPPALRNRNDVLVLQFLGNISLKKVPYELINGVWHYKGPKCLEDQEVHKMVDSIIAAVAAAKRTFKGAIKIIGPFPRLLTKCCSDEKHHLVPPNHFGEIIQYFLGLNHYLAIHPKLNFPQTEFIPIHLIFLNGFEESSIIDGIHLAEGANALYARFLASLPLKWQERRYQRLDIDYPAFNTWAATQQSNLQDRMRLATDEEKAASAAEIKAAMRASAGLIPLQRAAADSPGRGIGGGHAGEEEEMDADNNLGNIDPHALDG